ncbi:MAG: hypothetical protein AAF573_06145 [Bacteroidota bacterium]
MKQQLILPFTIFIICLSSLAGYSSISTTTVANHFSHHKFSTAYQIEIKSIKVLKRKGDNIKIAYNISNKGKYKVRFGKNKSLPQDLIIHFDKSLKNNGLTSLKANILQQLVDSDFSIRAGQLIMNNKMKIKNKPIAPTDRIAFLLEANRTPSTAVAEAMTQKEIIRAEIEKRKQQKNTAKLQITEQKESEAPQRKIAQQQTPKKKRKATSQLKLVPEIEDNSDNKPYGTQCADLILSKAEIVKENKRFVVVEYTIENIGDRPIDMLGQSKKDEDNIAIKIHFTRSEKLTRGAILAKVEFVKKGFKDNKGTLQPKGSYTQKVKISKVKMTKFTPVLAMTLDPFQSVHECSKFNNLFFLTAQEGEAPAARENAPIKPKLKGSKEAIGIRY